MTAAKTALRISDRSADFPVRSNPGTFYAPKNSATPLFTRCYGLESPRSVLRRLNSPEAPVAKKANFFLEIFPPTLNIRLVHCKPIGPSCAVGLLCPKGRKWMKEHVFIVEIVLN